jgi:hypothetical protein
VSQRTLDAPTWVVRIDKVSALNRLRDEFGRDRMATSLIHCIYASRASAQFRDTDIAALLEKARANNSRLDVTGILLYIEGSFFQILEGDEPVVTRAFETIRLDPRHQQVAQIIREPIAERDFAQWTMGFIALGLREAGEMIGENDFFADATCISHLDRGRAKKLLSAFKGGSWRIDQTGVFQSPGRVA